MEDKKKSYGPFDEGVIPIHSIDIAVYD